jgi:pimeloyl-ACP methyl ester carboxylesterase
MKRRFLLGFGAAAAVGAFAAYPRLRPHLWKWRMQIEELPLSGAVISYRDIGEGAPAAIIVSGVAVPKTAYLNLQTRLSGATRVITYDRPGLGESTPNAEPRTLAVVDKDMKDFLDALNVPPPYVLIGHSWGGHIIRYFADRHPGEVAGLVFLDQPHEDWFDYIRRTWSQQETDAYFKSWTAANPAYTGVLLEEVLAYEENCETIRGVPIPADVPVLMFTSSNFGHFRSSPAGLEEDRRSWARMQASLLTGVKDHKLLVDMELSHWLHQEKPDWVAGEIAVFIERLRG